MNISDVKAIVEARIREKERDRSAAVLLASDRLDSARDNMLQAGLKPLPEIWPFIEAARRNLDDMLAQRDRIATRDSEIASLKAQIA